MADPPQTTTTGRADSRQRMLDAGLRLLGEQPVGRVLGQLKARPVSEEAGMTTGAFFHRWDSQEAYWDDLLDHIFAVERIDLSERVGARLGALDLAENASGLIAAVAGAQVAELIEEPTFRVRVALWAASRDDPALQQRIRSIQRIAADQTAAIIPGALAALGRTLADGWTVERVATALTAAVEGAVLRAAIDTDADIPGLAGEMALAILHHVSQPTD